MFAPAGDNRIVEEDKGNLKKQPTIKLKSIYTYETTIYTLDNYLYFFSV